MDENRFAGLMSRLANGRGAVVPAVVGVLALLLAAVFAYITFRGPVSSSEAEPAAAPAVDTNRLVSRKGGFSVKVPDDMTVTRKGRTAQFVSDDKNLVVVVGPGEAGPLKQSSERFLNTLRKRYDRFTVLGTKPERVDGRRALTSYGQATNTKKVKIRFVSVAVRARPRNYTIAAYTAFDSDPGTVLPRVNAVVNGFKVRPAGQR